MEEALFLGFVSRNTYLTREPPDNLRRQLQHVHVLVPLVAHFALQDGEEVDHVRLVGVHGGSWEKDLFNSRFHVDDFHSLKARTTMN